MKDVIYIPTGDKGSVLYGRREKVMAEFCNAGWKLVGKLKLYDTLETYVEVWVLLREIK